MSAPLCAPPARGMIAKLARQLNMDDAFVSKVLRGRVEPKTDKGRDTVARVLDALRRESR